MEGAVGREAQLPAPYYAGATTVRLYVGESRAALVHLQVPSAGLHAECWTTVEGLTRLRDKLNAVLVSLDG